MHAKKMTFILLVLVLAIASFMLTATAAADGHRGSLLGTYVGTGSGSSLFAICGFGDQGFPNNASAGAYEIFLLNTQANWTFRPDGTGTVEALSQLISLPNTVVDPSQPPGFRLPWFGETTGKGDISYVFDPVTGQLDITDENIVVTWTSGPLAGLTRTTTTPFLLASGIVSQDRRAIKLNATGQPQPIGETIICPSGERSEIVEHLSSILIRQDQAPRLLP